MISKVLRFAIKQPNLTVSQKMTLIALYVLADGKPSLQVSYKSLKNITGVKSKITQVKAIRALQKNKLIKIKHEFLKNGSRAPSTYTLLDLEKLND